MVAIIAVVPAFVAVKEGTFPEPLATKPIAVLEFVQANVAPVGVLTKLVAVTVLPLVTAMFAGIVTVVAIVVVGVLLSSSSSLPEFVVEVGVTGSYGFGAVQDCKNSTIIIAEILVTCLIFIVFRLSF
jgi:hypothetical protein